MKSRDGRNPQWQMLEGGLDTAYDIVNRLKRSFLPLLLTSVFYRILAFTILAPLVSGYAGLFFKGSGRLIVANDEIVDFILRPFGLVALLVIAACSLTLIALEQACLMSILIQKDTKDTLNRVARAFRFVLQRTFGIHKLAFRIVARILLTSAPFAILAWLIHHTLLSEHDINYYLTNWPSEFKLAVAGGIILTIGLAIILIRYAVRVFFSLPVLLYEVKNPSQALRESYLKSKHRMLPMALGIAGWGLTVLAVSSLSTSAVIWGGRWSLPFLIGHNNFLVPAIGFLFLSLMLCQFLISMGATASFSVLVVIAYGTPVPRVKGLNSSLAGDEMVQSKKKVPVSGRVVIIGAVAAFVLAATTGWLLLSRIDLEDRTEVMAHRGASASSPENTMSAIEHAIVDGARWVEIDVQRTVDDRVVVIHDRDLMRIGNSPLVVSRTPYVQLTSIDVGSWFHPRFSDQRIPSLEAVLEHCKGQIKVNIELKYYGWDPHLAGQVIAIVESTGMENEIVAMSLSSKAVEQLKRERPDWQAGLLAAASLTDLAGVKADFLAVHSRMVTPGFVRRIHASGKTIQVWTVNDTIGMTKMFGMGVDAIITDEPGRAARMLAQRADMEPLERMLVTAGLLVAGEPAHVDPLTDGM